MALFYCDTCYHIQEAPNEYIEGKARCPKCKDGSGNIHNTVTYVKTLFNEIAKLEQKNKTLIAQTEKEKTAQKKHKESKTEQEELLQVHDGVTMDVLDVHNTDVLANPQQFAPVISWFKKRNIQASIDPKRMDMTGFFDEVAVYIGDNFSEIGFVVNQIRYAQKKGYKSAKFSLVKMSKKETQKIFEFAKLLHGFSFITRFSHIKKEKVLYLNLQEIPRIKTFFDGLWMEWYVLVKLLALFKEKGGLPPIARGVDLIFSNKERNELDIFYVFNNNQIPVCIECKTGEFRQDLNKYFGLRKKLGIQKEHFILCVFGLEEEQAKGLTSMYEITVINETMLLAYIQSL